MEGESMDNVRRILKYQITDKNAGRVRMPFGAEIISVQLHNEIPTIWALVDENMVEVERQFDLYWTGSEFTHTNYTHLCTYQDHNGLVWHVFEVPII